MLTPLRSLFALLVDFIRRGIANEASLLRVAGQTVSVAVEGKVAEPFGPTLEEWLVNSSDGKQSRLAYLRDLLGMPADIQVIYAINCSIAQAPRH